MEVYEESSVEDLEANEEDGADNAATQTRGGWTGFKNAFTATRWKAIGGIVAAFSAFGGITVVEEILAAIAEGNWEKVPTFDEFANQVIVPYSWPGVSGYDLEMAQLATSLQIGLRTSK